MSGPGDPYEIVGALGTGVYFNTFKGLDTLVHRPVFMKISNPVAAGADPEIHDAVIRAHINLWRSLSRFDIKGVPRANTYFVSAEGQATLVMEWIEGVTLDALVRQPSYLPMPPDRLLDWVLDGALRVLADLHDVGVVHGDLSASNIMVGGRRGDEVYLIDLAPRLPPGLAAEPDRQLILSTPKFQAPEVWAGEPTSAASDIFALGSVMQWAAEALGRPTPDVVRAMLRHEAENRPTARVVLANLHDRPPEPRAPTVGSSASGSPRSGPFELGSPAEAPLRSSAPRGRKVNVLGSLAGLATGMADLIGGLAAPRPKPEPRPQPASRPLELPPVQSLPDDRTILFRQPAPARAPEHRNRVPTSQLMNVPMPAAAAERAEKAQADFSVMAPSAIAPGSHFFVEL